MSLKKAVDSKSDNGFTDIWNAKWADKYSQNPNAPIMSGSGSPPPTQLTLPNKSQPTIPSSGGIVFVEDGDLKYIGGSGTITTIALS